VLIDVRTGRSAPVPQTPFSPRQGYPEPVSSTSPDGLYTLRTTGPTDCRVELEQAGTSKTIGTCSSRVLSISWLDGSHAVLRTSTCGGPCDDPKASLEFIDAAAGRISPLTDDTVEGAFALLSPDKKRFLVGGETLTEYDISGTERRRIEPQAGFRISEAIWSADGSSYAYIATPKGWYLYGP
jgi:hypothetical protein